MATKSCFINTKLVYETAYAGHPSEGERALLPLLFIALHHMKWCNVYSMYFVIEVKAGHGIIAELKQCADLWADTGCM